MQIDFVCHPMYQSSCEPLCRVLPSVSRPKCETTELQRLPHFWQLPGAMLLSAPRTKEHKRALVLILIHQGNASHRSGDDDVLVFMLRQYVGRALVAHKMIREEAEQLQAF